MVVRQGVGAVGCGPRGADGILGADDSPCTETSYILRNQQSRTRVIRVKPQ